MAAKKIIIAGGTGFIGSFLYEKYTKAGYKVDVISRQKGNIHWDEPDKIIDALENSEILINLAGKSINCRFTSQNKAEILSSRLGTTQLLGECIQKCKNPPSLWINSSAIGIYRHSTDKAMTETDFETDNSFISEVVQKWEQVFFNFQLDKTRKVALRFSVVLGKNGGAFPTLYNLVRFGLGGKQASGKQIVSWVHIYDLYNIIEHLKNNNNLEGVFNCSSPYPLSNNELMRAFRKAKNIPFGLPAPEFGIKLGTWIIGTEPELILKSQWVLPQRLIDSKFNFQFSQIEAALVNLITG